MPLWLIAQTRTTTRGENLLKSKSGTVGVVAHVGLVDVGPHHVVDVPGEGGGGGRRREGRREGLKRERGREE